MIFHVLATDNLYQIFIAIHCLYSLQISFAMKKPVLYEVEAASVHSTA